MILSCELLVTNELSIHIVDTGFVVHREKRGPGHLRGSGRASHQKLLTLSENWCYNPGGSEEYCCMKGMESVLLAAVVGLLGLGAWQARNWFPSLRSAASSLTAALIKSSAGKTPALTAGKPAAEAAKAKRPHPGRSSA